MTDNKASLNEKFALIHEHWQPKVVAQLNGQPDTEGEVLVFEPAQPRNTGNIVDEKFTAPNGVRI